MNTTPHKNYRCALGSIQDQPAFGSRKPWTLRDILREKKEKEEIKSIANTYRDRYRNIEAKRLGTFHQNQKITLVKRVKGGFHATGLGNLPVTYEELKIKARIQGYTAMKWMGKLVPLV